MTSQNPNIKVAPRTSFDLNHVEELAFVEAPTLGMGEAPTLQLAQLISARASLKAPVMRHGSTMDLNPADVEFVWDIDQAPQSTTYVIMEDDILDEEELLQELADVPETAKTERIDRDTLMKIMALRGQSQPLSPSPMIPMPSSPRLSYVQATPHTPAFACPNRPSSIHLQAPSLGPSGHMQPSSSTHTGVTPQAMHPATALPNGAYPPSPVVQASHPHSIQSLVSVSLMAAALALVVGVALGFLATF